MPQNSDYLNLITSFHAQRPKFRAMINALVDYFTQLQATINGLTKDFDIDFAVGIQLDAVGKWVGRSRNVAIPLPDSWFRFDDLTRGFDAGIWWGPYATPEGNQVLDDDTYRTLLKVKIQANEWDGLIASAQTAFTALAQFAPQSNVFLDDKEDMSFVVGVSGQIPSLLFLALLQDDWLNIKPEGVHRYTRIVSNVTTGGKVLYEQGLYVGLEGGGDLQLEQSSWPLFGFDVQNKYVSGFDISSWGVEPEYFTNGNPPVVVPVPPPVPSLDFSDEANTQYVPLV